MSNNVVLNFDVQTSKAIVDLKALNDMLLAIKNNLVGDLSFNFNASKTVRRIEAIKETLKTLNTDLLNNLSININTKNAVNSVRKLAEQFERLRPFENLFSSLASSVTSSATNMARNLNNVTNAQSNLISSMRTARNQTTTTMATMQTSGSQYAETMANQAFHLNQIIELVQRFGAIAKTAFNNVIQPAVEFETQLARISTLLEGDINANTAKLGEDVRRLSVSFGTDKIALAKAYYDAISTGVVNTSNATQLLTVANKLAIGGSTDIQTAIKGLTSAYAVYKDEISDINKYSDVFFVASAKGATNIEDLSNQMGELNSVAKNFNVSFDELYSTVSGMTTVLPNTSKVVTTLKAVLTSLSTPTEYMQQSMRLLGIESLSAAVKASSLQDVVLKLVKSTDGSGESITRMFGSSEAKLGVTNLLGSIEAIKEAQDAMNKGSVQSGKITDEAYDRLRKTTQNSLNMIKASIEETALALSNQLLPAYNKLLDAVLFLFKPTSELSTSMQILQATLVSVGIALSSSLAIMIAITTATKLWSVAQIGLNAVLAISPFGIVVAGIAVALPFIYQIIKTVGGFSVALEYAKGAVLYLESVILDVFNSSILKAINTPIGLLGKLFNALSEITILGDTTQQVFYKIGKELKVISETTTNTVDGIYKQAKATMQNADSMRIEAKETTDLNKAKQNLSETEQKRLKDIQFQKKEREADTKLNRQEQDALNERNKSLGNLSALDAYIKKQKEIGDSESNRQKELKKLNEEIETNKKKQKELKIELESLANVNVNKALELIDKDKELGKIRDLAGLAIALDESIKAEQLKSNSKILEAQIGVRKALINANTEREKSLIITKEEIRQIELLNEMEPYKLIEDNDDLKKIKEVGGNVKAYEVALSYLQLVNRGKELEAEKAIIQAKKDLFVESNKMIAKEADASDDRVRALNAETRELKLQLLLRENTNAITLPQASEDKIQELPKEQQATLKASIVDKSEEEQLSIIENNLAKLRLKNLDDLKKKKEEELTLEEKKTMQMYQNVLAVVSLVNSTLTNGFSSVTSFISGDFTSSLGSLFKILNDGVSAAVTALWMGLSKAGNAAEVAGVMGQIASVVISSISTTILATISTAKQALESAFELVTGSLAISLVSSISAITKAFSTNLTTFKNAMNDIKTALKGDDKAKELLDLSEQTNKEIEASKIETSKEISSTEIELANEKKVLELELAEELKTLDKELSDSKLKLAEEISAINKNDNLDSYEKRQKILETESDFNKDKEKNDEKANKLKTTASDSISKLEITTSEKIATLKTTNASDITKLQEESAKKVTEMQKEVVNPLTAVAQAFGKEITDGAKYLSANANEIGTVLTTAISSVVKSLVESAPLFVDFLVKAAPLFIVGLASNIGTLITSLIDAIPAVVSALIKALPPLFDALVASLPKLLDALLKGLFELLPKLIPQVVALVAEFIKVLISYLPELIKLIGLLVAELIKAIPGVVFAFVKALPDIIKAIITLIPVLIEALIKAVPELYNGLVKALPELIKGIVSAFPELIDSFVKLFSEPQVITGLVTSLLQALGFVIKELPSLFKDVGKALWESIKSAFKLISSLFDGMWGKGTVEKWLGIDIPFISFAEGGTVAGTARVSGNSLKNDTIPALLSPGEYVIDRETLSKGDMAIWNKLAQNGVVGFGFGGTWLGKALYGAGDVIAGVGSAVVEGAKGVGKLAGQTIVNVSNFVVDTGKDAFNITKGFIKGTSTAIIEGDPKALINNVGDTFVKTGEYFVNTATKSTSLVKEVLKGAGTVILDTAGNILSSSLPDEVMGIFNTVKKLFGATLKYLDLGSFIKDPKNYIGGLLADAGKILFKDQFMSLFKSFFFEGGFVSGQSNNRSNSIANDKIPAMLSAGELVIPRSHSNSLQNVVEFASQYYKGSNDSDTNNVSNFGGSIAKLSVDFSELISYLQTTDNTVILNIDSLQVAKAVRNQVKRGFAL